MELRDPVLVCDNCHKAWKIEEITKHGSQIGSKLVCPACASINFTIEERVYYPVKVAHKIVGQCPVCRESLRVILDQVNQEEIDKELEKFAEEHRHCRGKECQNKIIRVNHATPV